MNQSVMLSEKLTYDTVYHEHRRLLKLIEAKESHEITFDLNGVGQCDSAGLALLVDLKRFCQRRNQPLKMQNIPETIRALANFCGLQIILELVDHSTDIPDPNVSL